MLWNKQMDEDLAFEHNTFKSGKNEHGACSRFAHKSAYKFKLASAFVVILLLTS